MLRVCMSAYHKRINASACVCLYLCMHGFVFVYTTGCLSASQMTLLLIRNDAQTNGDSREKSQKPKVQKGNASIKILIKSTLFTQSLVTNDLCRWSDFNLFQHIHTSLFPITPHESKSVFYDRAICQNKRCASENCKATICI